MLASLPMSCVVLQKFAMCEVSLRHVGNILQWPMVAMASLGAQPSLQLFSLGLYQQEMLILGSSD